MFFCTISVFSIRETKWKVSNWNWYYAWDGAKKLETSICDECENGRLSVKCMRYLGSHRFSLYKRITYLSKEFKNVQLKFIGLRFIMGIIDYGDIIRRAKNRVFNATKKNLKILLKHTKKLQRQLKFLHQK